MLHYKYTQIIDVSHVAESTLDTTRGDDPPSGTHGDLPVYGSGTDYKLKEVADVENLYQLIDMLVRHKHLDMEQQRQQQRHAGGGGRGGGPGDEERLAAARAALEQEAAASLQLTDVAGLYKEVEKLCTLRKAEARPDAKETTAATTAGAGAVPAVEVRPLHESRDRALLVQEVSSKLLAHRPQSSAESTSVLSSLFGGEAASSATEQRFLRAVHRRCERESPAPVKGHRAVTLLSQQNHLRLLEEELAEKLSYVIAPLGRAEEEQFISEHRHENRMNTVRQGLNVLKYSLLPVLGCLCLVVSMGKDK